MNLLALVAFLVPPLAAVVLLREYRKSFQAKRRSPGDSSARWNDVMLEARKLRAAKAALAQPGPTTTAEPGTDPKPLP